MAHNIPGSNNLPSADPLLGEIVPQVLCQCGHEKLCHYEISHSDAFKINTSHRMYCWGLMIPKDMRCPCLTYSQQTKIDEAFLSRVSKGTAGLEEMPLAGRSPKISLWQKIKDFFNV